MQIATDNVSRETQVAILGKPLEHEYSLFELLRRPQVSYEGMLSLGEIGMGELAPAVREQVEIAAKYQGYIDRQKEEIAKQKGSENIKLTIDYADVHGLSIEARQKLILHKPKHGFKNILAQFQEVLKLKNKLLLKLQ